MKNINVKKNIIFNVLKTVFSVAYPVLTFTYVARIISVESLGMITFAKSIASYFILVATLGVNYYGIREAARVRNNKEKLSRLFWEVFSINLVSSIGSLTIMLICVFQVESFESYKFLLLLNSCSIILGGLSCEWVISAKEEYRFISLRSMGIQLFCIIAMFIMIRQEIDYWKYSVILVLSGYGSTVFNYFYIIKNRLVEWISPSEWNWKRHLKPIFILFAMYLSIELYTVLDTTMLGFIKGDRSVGLYSAAIKVPRLINSLITAVGVVLVPRLSYYYEENNDKFYQLINIALKIVIFLSIPCAIGVFMLPEGIIALLCGSQYNDAIVTTKILSLLTLIIPISVLFNNQIFIPMRKEKYVLYSTMIGALVNICFNIIMIPKFAENGAAIASVIAEFFVMCICLFYVRKKLGKLNLYKTYSWQLLKALVVFIIIFSLCLLIDNVILRLFIAILFCIPSYYFVCRNDIKRILKEIEM